MKLVIDKTTADQFSVYARYLGGCDNGCIYYHSDEESESEYTMWECRNRRRSCTSTKIFVFTYDFDGHDHPIHTTINEHWMNRDYDLIS